MNKGPVAATHEPADSEPGADVEQMGMLMEESAGMRNLALLRSAGKLQRNRCEDRD